jgi:hypothetical protein
MGPGVVSDVKEQWRVVAVVVVVVVVVVACCCGCRFSWIVWLLSLFLPSWCRILWRSLIDSSVIVLVD